MYISSRIPMFFKKLPASPLTYSDHNGRIYGFAVVGGPITARPFGRSEIPPHGTYSAVGKYLSRLYRVLELMYVVEYKYAIILYAW